MYLDVLNLLKWKIDVFLWPAIFVFTYILNRGIMFLDEVRHEKFWRKGEKDNCQN